MPTNKVDPRFIGLYAGYAIRIFEDVEERPWCITFESATVLRIGDASVPVEYAEVRERTLEAAKNTALALAQDYYSEFPRQDAIEWRAL